MIKIVLIINLLFGVLTFAQEQDSIGHKVIEIKEVLISPQKKKTYTDKAVYTFNKEELEAANHAKDLLITLPELQLDPISNTVKSIKGGRILFLINGIEASDNQIKSISPINVMRVEYFDVPPAKYSQRAETVLNIITKKTEVGYSYGKEVISALATGFVNGSLYGGYTKGKNDFGLEYSINLRDYNNRIADNNYQYILNNIHYRLMEKEKEHFGYTNQNIAIRYANIVPENYVFQVKLNLFINSSFGKGDGKSIFEKDIITENHETYHKRNSGFTSPNVDFYYSKKITKKDELNLNLIGSYYNTKSYQLDHEWETIDNTDIFNNEMNLKTNQSDIIGEVSHVHNFNNSSINSGYRIYNSLINKDLVNLQGYSKFSVNYLEQYLYTEYLGKIRKFSYRLGIGITNIRNKSREIIQNNWNPTPKIILSYNLKKNQSLRFSTQYTSESPSGSDLSSNIVQVVPNIVRKGNPYLKVSNSFKTSFLYSINNEYLDINMALFYNFISNYLGSKFLKYQNGYALTSDNAKNYNEYGLKMTGSIKPFKNKLLVAKIYVWPISEKLVSSNGDIYRRSFIKNLFILSSEYKNFSITYQFNIPVFSFEGYFLITNENKNNISMRYRYKNWSFSTAMYWLGLSAQYKTKSLSNSLVEYSRQSRIYNNKNMLILGLSYDLSTGKKSKFKKKVENKILPPTTF